MSSKGVVLPKTTLTSSFEPCPFSSCFLFSLFGVNSEVLETWASLQTHHLHPSSSHLLLGQVLILLFLVGLDLILLKREMRVRTESMSLLICVLTWLPQFRHHMMLVIVVYVTPSDVLWNEVNEHTGRQNGMWMRKEKRNERSKEFPLLHRSCVVFYFPYFHATYCTVLFLHFKSKRSLERGLTKEQVQK